MARCTSCGAEIPSDGHFCQACGHAVSTVLIPGKCPTCGEINALEMKRCGNCGTPLPEFVQKEAPAAQGHVMCRWCGNPALPGEDECWQCRDRSEGSYLGDVDRRSGRAEGSLMIGAVLLVIAGLLALCQGLFYLAFGALFVEVSGEASGYLTCCGILDILFGLGGVFGGYFASKCENYTLALIGAIVAMLGLGFGIGGLLGFVSILLVWSEKEQFE